MSAPVMIRFSLFHFLPDAIPVESGKRCDSFAAIVVKWKKWETSSLVHLSNFQWHPGGDQQFGIRRRVSPLKILLNLLEIDIPLLHIRADKLHLEPVAHIDAFNPIEQPAFDRGLKDADPCPFVGRARADGVKPVSDP
jgi:hypothetical protein